MVTIKGGFPSMVPESFTGADCSGSDKTENRVLTTSNISSAFGAVQVFMEGRLQIENTDYTISGNDITFTKVIFNQHRFRIYYVA